MDPMPMHLYSHNQTAYNAVVTMLAERGKAAVIHPTGTGKSFIGFKLCEDNADKTICWHTVFAHSKEQIQVRKLIFRIIVSMLFCSFALILYHIMK